MYMLFPIRTEHYTKTAKIIYNKKKSISLIKLQYFGLGWLQKRYKSKPEKKNFVEWVKVYINDIRKKKKHTQHTTNHSNILTCHPKNSLGYQNHENLPLKI